MNLWRVPVYGVLVVAIAVAGYAAAWTGLAWCAPADLPGDEDWAGRMRLYEAFRLLAGTRQPLCFAESAAGAALLGAVGWLLPAIAVIFALVVLWELAGPRWRLAVLGRWGGHAILAGNERTLRRVSEAESGKSGVIHVALDGEERRALQRWRPFREVVLFDDRAEAASLLDGLGARKARLIVAATDSDLVNKSLCEAALEVGSSAELQLRLEQPSMRVLGSQHLRRQAEACGLTLTMLSLTQMHVRRGVGLAMPGRYVDERASRAHIVICGSGFGVQEAAFHIARQGYGLSAAKPLITVVRTGHGDMVAAALSRLTAAADAGIADLALSSIDTTDELALDRAIVAMALTGAPISAVHCLGEHPGEAQELARSWEQVLLGLGLPVPPIVAYGGRPGLGQTGMLRTADRIDLADAGAFARTMDQRARLCHQSYLGGQRRTRGAKFGSLEAEVDWPLLLEGYRDDNRNVADHIDYKLALVNLAARADAGPGAALSASDIDMLAPVEHSRWFAAKALAGFRFGERDPAARLHPDMKPFDALDEDARRKDRQGIEALPGLLALGGQRLVRDACFGAMLAPDAAIDAAATVAALTAWQARHRDRQVLLRLPLDGAGPLALAEAILAAGMRIEVVQDRPVFAALGADMALRRRAASVMREATRICVVSGRTAREAIAAEAHTIVDAEGKLHADFLA